MLKEVFWDRPFDFFNISRNFWEAQRRVISASSDSDIPGRVKKVTVLGLFNSKLLRNVCKRVSHSTRVTRAKKNRCKNMSSSCRWICAKLVTVTKNVSDAGRSVLDRMDLKVQHFHEPYKARWLLHIETVESFQNQWLWIWSREYGYVFCMIALINSHYLLIQYSQTCLSDGCTLCSLRGTNWEYITYIKISSKRNRSDFEIVYTLHSSVYIFISPTSAR